MSQVTTQIDINHVRKMESELFGLIEEQVKDKIDGTPFNSERAKRIDDLQTLYSKYVVHQ